MKKKNRILSLFLAGSMLLTAGCRRSTASPAEGPVPAETETADHAAGPFSPEASLNSLRQAMVETPQLFAVAYFGFHPTRNGSLPVDPFAVMQDNAPTLCEDLPFLLDIPEDRIVGESGDLFCIVPLDENATVAVSKGYWDEENQQYIYDDILYSSDAGDPLLLLCNSDGWGPDTEVYISGPSGEVFWYPQEDDNRCVMPLRNDEWETMFFDFSPYREMLAAEHRRMEAFGWVKPTEDFLTGTTWRWFGFLKDGRYVRYEVTFDADTLSVRWNDGIDITDHEYLYASWELTQDEGYAVLTIDFREFAGILRYDLLYHREFEELYVAMDVVQENGNVGWEPLYRCLMRTAAPEPTEMIGSWELAWTEVEGDRSDAEQGTRWIEIFPAASGSLLISCGSEMFPQDNFYDELLTIDMRQLYTLCGNDEWVADVDYVGPWDTSYTVTLTADDILIKQNYFLLDGAPTVSYEYFRRVGESNAEDPYAHAISQGCRIPEPSELMDTFWLSRSGYALELAEDSVPGDNGGWAKLYDVDEIGAYTESYSGSWQYEDGLLYLSLVPAEGNGVFVDDSFPVLMLDEELRIGRAENGIGLPHFYTDMLMDTLEQPKG